MKLEKCNQAFDIADKKICEYVAMNGNKPNGVLIFIDYDHFYEMIGELTGDIGHLYELYRDRTIFGNKVALVVDKGKQYPLVTVVVN